MNILFTTRKFSPDVGGIEVNLKYWQIIFHEGAQSTNTNNNSIGRWKDPIGSTEIRTLYTS